MTRGQESFFVFIFSDKYNNFFRSMQIMRIYRLSAFSNFPSVSLFRVEMEES